MIYKFDSVKYSSYVEQYIGGKWVTVGMPQITSGTAMTYMVYPGTQSRLTVVTVTVTGTSYYYHADKKATIYFTTTK
ncbi:MAG TPA: hypothetical protein VJH96_00640 [Patescibacteria group bacterium]|nr:hypothetical protein [Patescibacteria group bacterium]